NADHSNNTAPYNMCDVQTIMIHMAGSYRYFAAIANGEPPPSLVTPPAVTSSELATAASRTAEAWRRPGALDGTCQLPTGEAPKQEAATIDLVELYAHGWDLAKATGQQLSDSPGRAAAALPAAQHIVRPEVRAGAPVGVKVARGAG